jgi:hypothetical protein
VPTPEQLAEAEKARNAQAQTAEATAGVDVGIVQGTNQAIDNKPDARLAGAPKTETTDATAQPVTTATDAKKSTKKEKTPKAKK